MKKYKTTFKQIKNNNSKVVNIGYCAAQHLLYFSNPTAYSSGIYGWNCDFYQITPAIVIATGYRTMGKLTKYDVVEKYDNEAQKIILNKSIPRDDKKSQIEKLILDFIKVV
jgi:hypothetical protein